MMHPETDRRKRNVKYDATDTDELSVEDNCSMC